MSANSRSVFLDQQIAYLGKVFIVMVLYLVVSYHGFSMLYDIFTIKLLRY